MHTHKHKYISLLFLMAASVLGACSKSADYNQPTDTDKTKPAPVSKVTVVNSNGAATISYDLPKSSNILYVRATYKTNTNLIRKTQVSYYDNKIEVAGFAEKKEYEVMLTTVSRAEVESDPVVVKVFPDTPAYRLVLPTLTVNPTFGGIYVTATNKMKEVVGVVVITEDKNKEYTPVESNYSKKENIGFGVRGFANVARRFGIFVVDRWGNTSDTLYQTLTPLYEELISKSKFMPYPLPTDAPEDFGWSMPYLWDGDNGNNGGKGFHTSVDGTMPKHFTFDMGVSANLSRYKIWERSEGLDFYAGNPKKWRIWGTNTTPAADGSFNGWILLGDFDSPPKPSGLPVGWGNITAEDVAFNHAGFEFNFPDNIPPVRYIRFETLDTWGSATFVHLMEITLWGQVRP